MEKTNAIPVKLRGLSRDEARNALCSISLVNLTWRQGREAFRQIIDIIEQVRERYER